MANLSSRAILGALVLCATYCRAVLTNVTIDDVKGDERTGAVPTYGGGGGWHARASKDDCPDCKIQLDPEQLRSGTWHDSSTFIDQAAGEISFKFTGTDLFVYNVLAGPKSGGRATHTFLTLVVDGKGVDTFQWLSEDNTPNFQYDQLTLVARGLESKEHSVVIINNQTAVGNTIYASLILFDYVMYTTEDGQTTTTSASVASHSPSSISTPSSTASSPQEPAGQSLIPTSATQNLALPLGLGLGLGLALIICTGIIVFVLLRRNRQPHYDPQSPSQWVVDPSGRPISAHVAGSAFSPSDGTRTVTSASLGSPSIAPLPAQKLSHREELADQPPQYTMPGVAAPQSN